METSVRDPDPAAMAPGSRAPESTPASPPPAASPAGPRCSRWLGALSAAGLGAALLGSAGCGSDGPSSASASDIPYARWDYVAGRARGPRPSFSFFVTSQEGLFGLTGGEYFPDPDPALGFGGDLGGLAGADEICRTLAGQANPGDTKEWRAFLSTSGLVTGQRVDAIDRIGYGPWYDFNERKLAHNLDELMPEDFDGRPSGADPQLARMFTGEAGLPAQPSSRIDNHDILTGSNQNGRLFDDGEEGLVATCGDWTSKTLRGRSSGAAGVDGQIPVGHSWPRNNVQGRHWISEHTVNGCEPGYVLMGTAPAAGDYRVGAGGGYGAIYCFALGAVEPGKLD